MLSESNQDFISGQRKRFTSLQFAGSSVLRRHFRKQRIADILEKSRLSPKLIRGIDSQLKNAGTVGWF
ncbi:hypothetical protein CEXT_182461 [Caerostris extrusa]|uniref:Uncharacterized protein n=1 Tax=Caerostris extrusa TaxID=172846 RepID=A0AAV4MVA6_CAEEX|nr:hypothetical protein CEXT_182461 [Caerostris extrusa]